MIFFPNPENASEETFGRNLDVNMEISSEDTFIGTKYRELAVADELTLLGASPEGFPG